MKDGYIENPYRARVVGYIKKFYGKDICVDQLMVMLAEYIYEKGMEDGAKMVMAHIMDSLEGLMVELGMDD